MHKRNTALIALLFAVPITLIVTLWSSAHRSDAVGIFYFPALLLSVIFSGRTREIGPIAEWSSFIVYTLVYVVIALIIYALLLESYLLRRGFAQLHRAYDTQRAEDSAPQSKMEDLGRAIHDVESRRRKHWLLDNTKSIDLSEPPELLAARALRTDKPDGPAKGILKKLKGRMVKHRGVAEAEAEITKLKAHAEMRMNRAAAKGGS
jgi:hypothetical protein